MNQILENIIIEATKTKVSVKEDFLQLVKKELKGKNKKKFPSNIILLKTYRAMLKEGKIVKNMNLEKILVTKKMRSLSGVSIITVLTKPWPCPGKCIYCPTQKDVPKSYLLSEPAVMRAILCGYDPYKQVRARLDSLKLEGHPTDKIELIVIGGTFSALQKNYQEKYITECFRALNFQSSISNSQATANIKNSKFTLADEKRKNETAKHRCVGLTLETRPDHITADEVKWFRYLGATRVELGVQTVFDDILESNKRGHGIQETVKATKLLKNAGFKICYHMMPGLPYSNIKKDLEMFKIIFSDQRFQPDYVKIYPCVVTKGSELYDLWKAGKYKPYTDKELENLICEIKKITPFYVRIMRLIRDIPSSEIEAGSKISNLRQNAQRKLRENGQVCKCIRCREIGQIQNTNLKSQNENTKLKIFQEKYSASGGTEYFLSYETKDRKSLFALLRLRFPAETYLDELEKAAIIRELHTYGQQTEIGKKGETQHKGLGKNLILKAEKLARDSGYKRVAVISGIGVRDYYKNLGYSLNGEYMVKDLK